jgi:ABC-type lipoprotein export system ATPase subunit
LIVTIIIILASFHLLKKFEASHNDEMQMECISNRCIGKHKKKKKTKSENIHVCNLEYRHNHYQISMKKTDRVQIYFNKKNIHRRRKNLSGAQIKCEY